MWRSLILFSLLLPAPDAAAKKYSYTNYGVSDTYRQGRDVLLLDSTERETVIGGTIDELHFCKTSDRHYCFFNASISFYVPKGKIHLADEWAGVDAKFEVIRKEKLALLGSVTDVWVIRATRKDRNDVFYYSERCGLVAIKFISSRPSLEGASIYFLDQGNGFPR